MPKSAEKEKVNIQDKNLKNEKSKEPVKPKEQNIAKDNVKMDRQDDSKDKETLKKQEKQEEQRKKKKKKKQVNQEKSKSESSKKPNKRAEVIDKKETIKETEVIDKEEEKVKKNHPDKKTKENKSNKKTNSAKNVKQEDVAREKKIQKANKKTDKHAIEKEKTPKVNKEDYKKIDDGIEKEVIAEEKEHTKLIKFEDIKNFFKKKKTVPKEELKNINKPVFKNILVAVVVIIYCIFLILGFNNIDGDVYQTDLKVFAMCILFLAILLLEKAYKKDSGTLAIYGIEAIIISIITFALIYVNLMFADKYINIVLIISYVLAIYYVLKSIIIFIRGRKKYFVEGMKEMINNDEE